MAVIGVPDPTFVEAVCAVIVIADGEELTVAEVMDHCMANVASYKRPKRVEFVDALPRTASLKIQKFVLRERFGAASNPLSTHALSALNISTSRYFWILPDGVIGRVSMMRRCAGIRYAGTWPVSLRFSISRDSDAPGRSVT